MREKTVLIVDDNIALCESLEDVLRDSGYAPVSAHSCSQGLKRAEEVRPPVVLLDQKLPDGMGTELLAKIKQMDPECVCIIITAYADVDSAVMALRDGAYHFLRKPVRPEELLKLVEQAFERVFLREKARSAEEALRESEKKYRLVVENANDAIFIEQEGEIRFCNPMAEKVFGCARDAFSGVSFGSLIHPDDRSSLDRIHRRELSAPSVPVRILSQRREEVWVHTSLVPVDWGGRPAVLYFLRDVTAQKQLEAQLLQWQKTEAIGTLSGGIAHDFNNILAAIIGYTEIAMLDTADNDKAQNCLKAVLKSSFRAKKLVEQILAYSRQSKPEMKPTALAPVVKEALKLMRAMLPVTIEIRQHLDESAGRIAADASQIHQVIVNLCDNAAHAMKEQGGVLEVSLTRRVLDEAVTALHPDLAPGPYYDLSVSDTGHGMTPEVQQRIFDPFFTTKDVGQGTGLGLSVVHGIVKAHRGAVTVQSRMNEGTIFHIYLPEIDRSKEAPEEASVSLIPGGTERILFVDDAEILTQTGKAGLESLGYHVETKTDPIEALSLFRGRPDGFDLVISDMTMPGLTGDQLAREILKIRPDMPVILCTGYSERITEEKARAIGIRRLLMKPVSRGMMGMIVREVLDGQ